MPSAISNIHKKQLIRLTIALKEALYIPLVLFIVSVFPTSAYAQCTAAPSNGRCNGTTLTNGANINSGNYYSFNGGPSTYSSISEATGGTLVICGSLTISTFNFNGGILIINPGGSLTINSLTSTLGNVTIYNFGTLTINADVNFQNGNDLFMNASTSAQFYQNNSTYSFKINSANSFFINYGAAYLYNINISNTAFTAAFCLGTNSILNTTNLTNSMTNSVSAPSGQACLRVTGSATMTSSLSSTSNLKVCMGSGATSTGSFGSATVSTNCSSCSVALPITLLNFRAIRETGQVKLDWTTGSETQNLYFDLEKSADGISWTSIATVRGAGTTTSETSYQAIDHSPLKTDAYYRLKQVDISGSFSYSNIIRIPATSESMNIGVSPNPNKGTTIRISGIDLSLHCQLTLMDMNGRQVFQTIVQSDEVHLPTLLKGLYLMRIINTQTNTASLVKYVVQ